MKQQQQDTDLIAALRAYEVLLRDMKGNGRIFSRLRSKVEQDKKHNPINRIIHS